MRRAVEISIVSVLWCLLAATVFGMIGGLGLTGAASSLARGGRLAATWVLLCPLPLACGLLWALPSQGWRRSYRRLAWLALGAGPFLAVSFHLLPLAWPLTLTVVVLKERERALDAQALNRAAPPSPAVPASGWRSGGPGRPRP